MPTEWLSSPGPKIPERKLHILLGLKFGIWIWLTNFEQKFEATVNNPWWLETHGEEENEPDGGASVCGGQGLNEGQEGAGGCHPDYDRVGDGGFSELRVQGPEE